MRSMLISVMRMMLMIPEVFQNMKTAKRRYVHMMYFGMTVAVGVLIIMIMLQVKYGALRALQWIINRPKQNFQN